MTTTFQLLGPVRAWRDGRELALGSPQQRTLLAVLLLREGLVATVDELVMALWDTEPPVTAVGMLRTYVSRLRRVLGDDVDVHTYGPGYLLNTPREQVDVRRFRHLTDRARQSVGRGDHLDALRDLRAAVGLHRGTALTGAAGPFAERQRHRLDELVVTARLDLHAAGIALGRYEEALPDLAVLAAEHPFWERVHELRMRALFETGRPAEALLQYHALRNRLAETLGIDPGARLQHLYREILLADRLVSAAG
ncbi:AfsR/SARP family transcriptional regulator [Actinoplanes subglobosus]|uniref:BTAD domain-containing putative transcriptional regulator n=1 Tax=Actinoplanes subglobosus TaxID=1547892 RepID=A0ABV8IRQ0_9ACTN